MATRRAICGVLENFLRTYTSRHSDFNGYWLFGFLANDIEEFSIDLLSPSISEPEGPIGFAVRSAVDKFEDQVRKAGLSRPQIQEAWLTIRKRPDPVTGSVNGRPCLGNEMRFLAGAVMEANQTYERSMTRFVAPHDAKVELRSTRAAEPKVN